MIETYERGHEFNLILGWCDDKYFRRFGALRESHLDVLHKGATYEGSGMPDTRRDLFSLSTTTGPLATTVRENINSIHTSCWWLRMLRPRFHTRLGIDVPANSHCFVTPRRPVVRFISFRFFYFRKMSRWHLLRNVPFYIFSFWKREKTRDELFLYVHCLVILCIDIDNFSIFGCTNRRLNSRRYISDRRQCL